MLKYQIFNETFVRQCMKYTNSLLFRYTNTSRSDQVLPKLNPLGQFSKSNSI